MPISFDSTNKYILITSPTTEISALEIYSAAMDWSDELTNGSYGVPIEAVGKFDMGGGAYTDSIFMLRNGWKIKFWSGTYQANVMGTLLGEPGQQRTVPPDSGNVEVIFQVSSQGIIIPDIAEWTQTEKNGIISDVNTIEAETINLPSDPASESHITAEVDDLITRAKGLDETHDDLAAHDTDVKGPAWTNESLKKILEKIEEQSSQQVITPPKSIAEYLNKLEEEL